MSRYIDAEKILSYISRLLGAMPVAVLKMAETDGIDIVRCGECKWWWKEAETCKHDNLTEGDLCATFFKADDFCSYGERKDNGKDIQSATE